MAESTPALASLLTKSSGGGTFFSGATVERTKPKPGSSRSKTNEKNATDSRSGQRTIVLPLSGGAQAVCVVCPSDDETDDGLYGRVTATVAENQSQSDRATRKANHTEVERRRRQRIRFFIEKLASICMPGVSAGEVTTGNVLEKTYEHVMQVHADLNSLKVEHERDTKMQQEYQMTLDIALKDLEKLRATLTEHKIPLPPLRLRVVDVPSASTATVAESSGGASFSGKKRSRPPAKRIKVERSNSPQRENADEEESSVSFLDNAENDTANGGNMYGGVAVGVDDDAEEAEEN